MLVKIFIYSATFTCTLDSSVHSFCVCTLLYSGKFQGANRCDFRGQTCIHENENKLIKMKIDDVIVHVH